VIVDAKSARRSAHAEENSILTGGLCLDDDVYCRDALGLRYSEHRCHLFGAGVRVQGGLDGSRAKPDLNWQYNKLGVQRSRLRKEE
jgi:hypothetical protein